MKKTTCKRCNAENVYWSQGLGGRWSMREVNGGAQHKCDDRELIPVKCKYCKSDDLHWAEELRPDGSKKAVLTESYGLPHACDERIAFMAAERKQKNDEYKTQKTRIEATPDGPCVPCNGAGYSGSYVGACNACLGLGRFDVRSRKYILSTIRSKLWPHLSKIPRW